MTYLEELERNMSALYFDYTQAYLEGHNINYTQIPIKDQNDFVKLFMEFMDSTNWSLVRIKNANKKATS